MPSWSSSGPIGASGFTSSVCWRPNSWLQPAESPSASASPSRMLLNDNTSATIQAVRSVSLAVVVLAGCGACGSPPLVTSDCFGPIIAPPRGLAKIHPGMTVAEAKKLVPELHEPSRKGIRDELVIDSGCNAVTLEV